MCNYRLNQKSVRISDDVLNYIESYEGNSFNDKLNNLILYFMSVESDKKKEVERLDSLIMDKEKEYSDMFSHFLNLREIKRTKEHFLCILNSYEDDLKEFNSSFLKVVGSHGE